MYKGLHGIVFLIVLFIVYLGLNKYKKRRYHKTTNLLTGETDVHPDLIQVSHYINKVNCV